VICETYKDVKPRVLKNTTTIEGRSTQILSDFVNKRFQLGPTKKPYDDVKTVKHLTYLASNLTTHSQEIFLNEQIQASWLSRRLLRWLYVFISRIVVSITFWLFFMFVTILMFVCLSPFGIKPWPSNPPAELRTSEIYSFGIFLGFFVSIIVGFLGGFGAAVVDAMRLNLNFISTVANKFSPKVRVVVRCLLIGSVSGWLGSRPLIALSIEAFQEQGQNMEDRFVWTFTGLTG